MDFRIATRKSLLAQVQTDIVIKLLNERFHTVCSKVLIETLGDRILDVKLDKIGGKGLFVKDIEKAMLEGEADAAVHSMKDVPFELPEGFVLAAVPEREDSRDAFISADGTTLKGLPKGAKVGTSSNRRAAQLLVMRPDIEIVPIRGNVQTRIDKIKKENLHGVILAAAGLKRLGMEDLITEYIDIESMVPAIGQGALGIETAEASEAKELISELNSLNEWMCTGAERSFMKRLNGDCHSTIGAYAELSAGYMHILGIFQYGSRLIKKDIEGKAEEYISLGEKLGDKIINF